MRAPSPDPSPATAPAPSVAVDAKALIGAWTAKDDAKIVWTFNDDGTVQTKTSFKDFANHYQVNGAALTIKPDEALPEKHYTVKSVTEHQLVLDDTEHGITREFAK